MPQISVLFSLSLVYNKPKLFKYMVIDATSPSVAHLLVEIQTISFSSVL